MIVHGLHAFPAPPPVVWVLLMDVSALASCIPGCERLEPLGDNRYKAVVNVSLAAISGRFDGTVTLADMQSPTSYTLAIDARGRTGFVHGTAAVTLEDVGAQTVVAVKADMHVGGPVARVGQRLLGTVSKMMLDRFLACLAGRLQAS
jgi:carbon monoxide dehydrogenase subunit G